MEINLVPNLVNVYPFNGEASPMASDIEADVTTGDTTTTLTPPGDDIIMVGVTTDPEEEGGAPFIKKEGARRKAILWPMLEKQEGNKTLFPFLDRTNCDRNYQLCSVVAMQQVFVSSHGSKTKVWEEVRAMLAGMRGKDQELLFPDGINSISTLKRRLDNLLKWIKNN